MREKSYVLAYFLALQAPYAVWLFQNQIILDVVTYNVQPAVHPLADFKVAKKSNVIRKNRLDPILSSNDFLLKS